MNRKPRVALVRGPALSVFELQSYEPLLDRFDFTAFGLAQHHLDTDTLRIPCEKLRWKDAISGRSASNAYRSRFKGQRYYMPALEKRLEDFDVIHSWEMGTTFSWQCAQAKGKYGIPLIITSTENIPYPGWNEPDRLRMKKEILARADFFFALTPDARDVLLTEGVEPSRIDVVPFGVDLDRFAPSAPSPDWMQKLGVRQDDFVVTFVGRLVWEKGIYDLIAACRKLAPKGLRILVAGSGPEKAAIERFVRTVGMEHVLRLVTAVPYGQIQNIYHLSSVVVLPSIPTLGVREQFGMVLAEAMACGIPVVATRCGSMPWVIGDAGLLADSANAASLADCLTRLRESESLRRQLGKRGRQIAEERYDRQRVAEKIGSVFKTVLSRS